jgi:hypothetical protein
MTDYPVIVDGVLKQWGDRLFYEPVKAKRVKSPVGFSRKKPSGGNSAGRSASSADRVRKMLSLTAKKTPEVLVKISKARKGSAAVKTHLDYISRNGKLSLEDQDGQKIEGKAATLDFMREWKEYGRITEPSSSRAAFSIVLSMPAGTDREAVNNAARDFAKKEFADNHKYVFVPHNDEKHSHVHLCVLALGRDGTRLNPRKADIQRWREGFAEALRGNGIEANATRRNVRGVYRKGIKQPVLHADKGKRSFTMEEQRKAVVEELTKGKKQPNPYNSQMIETRGTVQTAYSEIINALRQSPNPNDRELAAQVRELVDKMKPIETKREEAVREFKETRGKEKDRGKER